MDLWIERAKAGAVGAVLGALIMFLAELAAK